ncbi:glycoside hydrolase family 9 protein [Agarivorans sp. DSG3-1]|uniref:glycoside hydrolase family 9 protein n=1 Tax=Agarivorans sp. DSG3-1 TaxID=3342249 RepID=UPI00398EEB3F
MAWSSSLFVIGKYASVLSTATKMARKKIANFANKERQDMMLRKTLLATAIVTSAMSAQAANYGEALQKSIYFYEAQQSGVIPDWNRTEWRGDSALNDGSDNNVDLTGGWYDAGDHVKFGFPMASTATMLAWGVIEYPEAYSQTNQLEHIKNNLRFVADYFLKAHTAPNELYGQVGGGSIDHAWWGSAEVMQMERPSYKIDAANPGSDLAGETAAALAAISMVFAESDPVYSATLLDHAKQLYSFADNYRGKYSDAITDAKAFYNSWSGYQDELVWGAIWLYRATNDVAYLDKAKLEYPNLGNEGQTEYRAYKWGQAWDDKSYGSYVLLAKLTGEQVYQDDAERWLDYWTTGFNGEKIAYTPGGLAFLDVWGAARYTSNTSFLALIYSDFLKANALAPTKAATYYDFAKSQLDYILGDNPLNISYQIGYGSYHPTKPHHRTAHGAWADSLSSHPVENRHLLIGALVGGPGKDDSYADDRGDYYKNEVATDYNAGFTSALARLWLDHGGAPIAEEDFPPKEVRDTELYIDAKVNSEGPRHIEISARVHNHTAWPSRVTDKLSLRYWVDLTEVVAAGYTANDVTVSTAYSQGSGFSGLHPWGNEGDNIYYAEISFDGVDIYPGGQSPSKKEVQFRLALPTSTNNPDWDNANDPSWDSYSNAHELAPKIAMYDAGLLVWGAEPSAACGGATGINCAPIAQSQTVATPFDTPASITLAATDSDGTIASYAIASQPAHGSVTLSGDVASYVPTAGYFGSDSFSFTASDDQAAVSQAATVTVDVAAPIIPAVTISSPTNGTEVSPSSDVNLQLDVANAHGANVYLDGALATSRVGSGAVTLTMPDTEGTVAIVVIATDEQGTEISAEASLSLVVKQGAVTPVGDLTCEVGKADSWSTGFVINAITVTNGGTEAVTGWKVNLAFSEAVSLANGWNAELNLASDGLGISASNVVHNGQLAPSASASFGLQGEHSGNFVAPTCVVLP